MPPAKDGSPMMRVRSPVDCRKDTVGSPAGWVCEKAALCA